MKFKPMRERLLASSMICGAALLGLRGLVFKSHGSADAFAFEQALNRAYDAARNNLLDRVQSRIAHARPLLAGNGGDAQLETATS